MRDYSNFGINNRVDDHESYLAIYISVLLKNNPLHYVGFIECIYFKKNKSLTIEDMNTRPEFWRKGLGLLRISEVLKLLKEKNLEIETVVAEGVGCYSPTPEIRSGVEAFWSSLGFKASEQDKWLEEWTADGKTLETKLKEKL
jgi:GNAT superfamily N-acetyltransferase